MPLKPIKKCAGECETFRQVRTGSVQAQLSYIHLLTDCSQRTYTVGQSTPALVEYQRTRRKVYENAVVANSIEFNEC